MKMGRAIRMCRIARNMKQKELAAVIGCSVSYLSLMERGQRDLAYSTFLEISDALNVPPTIVAFLAADGDELNGLSEDLVARMSMTALQLIHASNDEDEGGDESA